MEAAVKATPQTQTAMMTPPASPPPPMTVPPATVTEIALVQEIKKELRRVGCYGGRIDDRWTTSATKLSVQRFVKYARLAAVPDKPTVDLLEAIRGTGGRLCPLECRVREVEKSGRCVAKTCPRGQYLKNDGTCEIRGAKKKHAKRSDEKPGRTATPTRENSVRRADRARAAGTYKRCMGARTGCYERAVKTRGPEGARAWCSRRPTC
jgi:hypothetical protein